MRIVATAAVIAIVATTTSSCGSSSPSSSPPPHTATTTAADRTAAALAPTTAPPAAATATRTATTPASGPRGKTVPHLVGQPLDVAERMLRDAGISYKVIRLHNHAGGAARTWGVCEADPAPGRRVSSARVELIVAHSKCGAR